MEVLGMPFGRLVALLMLTVQLILAEEQQVEPRIVGGSPVKGSDYPFFISWGGCGATLIHNDIGLSAAHCIERNAGYRALVGARKRFSTDGGAVFVEVVSSVRHPNFDVVSQNYDFLVMKLSGFVTKEVAKLEKKDSLKAGDKLDVVGFGRTSEDGPSSDVLLSAELSYMETAQCSDILNDYSYSVDGNTMLCALGEGADTCQGDSGGPILDSSGVQVGISSWGIGCARDGVPGVYARTSGMVDWIEDQICNLSDNPPQSCRKKNEPLVPSGLTGIRVDILYDDSPEDTGWRIRRSDGTVIKDVTAGTIGQEGVLWSSLVYLQNGAYDFEIYDLKRNGFRAGEGSYSIVLLEDSGEDDEVLFQGSGNFGESVTRSFIVGPTLQPTVSPTRNPTVSPTETPTVTPTVNPTVSPTMNPTVNPTVSPTVSPSANPTANPTELATTILPDSGGTEALSNPPSVVDAPTIAFTSSPTPSVTVPILDPSLLPTEAGSSSLTPSIVGTTAPSFSSASTTNSTVLTSTPSSRPSSLTMNETTSVAPVIGSSNQPSFRPVPTPTSMPSVLPSTGQKTERPSMSLTPFIAPAMPSNQPSATRGPSATITTTPSQTPSTFPFVASAMPSNTPSIRQPATTQAPTRRPETSDPSGVPVASTALTIPLRIQFELFSSESPTKVDWRILSLEGVLQAGSSVTVNSMEVIVALEPGIYYLELSDFSGESHATASASRQVGSEWDPMFTLKIEEDDTAPGFTFLL